MIYAIKILAVLGVMVLLAGCLAWKITRMVAKAEIRRRAQLGG
jgi:hypothetical protein